MIKNLAITLVIILTANAKVSQAQYDHFRPQIDEMYKAQADRESEEMKPLTDSTISTAEATQKLRKFTNSVLRINMQSDDLETVLAESAPVLVNAEASDDSQYQQYLTLNEEQLNQLTLEAAKQYSGDYKDFSDLAKDYTNMVTGLVLSGNISGKQYKFDFISNVGKELDRQIDEKLKQRFGVTSEEDLKKHSEYYDQHNAVVAFTNKQMRISNQAFSKAASISKNKSEARNSLVRYNNHKVNTRAKLYTSIMVAAHSAYLRDDYITSENVADMSQRITAMIKALIRVSKDSKSDPTPMTSHMADITEMMKEQQLQDDDNRNKFFDAIIAAAKSAERIVV